MYRLFLKLVFLLLCGGAPYACAAQQTDSLTTEEMGRMLLTATIDSMLQETQFWQDLERQAMLKKLDTLNAATVMRMLRSVDSTNLITLKTLFSQFGFPGIAEYGKKTSRQYVLLIQRADPDPKFQEKVLIAMKQKVDEANASAADYAFLVDLVRTNTNRRQLYGTQVRLNEDTSKLILKPVEDPERLNERRKALGLGTIEEYLKTMEERYGIRP